MLERGLGLVVRERVRVSCEREGKGTLSARGLVVAVIVCVCVECEREGMFSLLLLLSFGVSGYLVSFEIVSQLISSSYV